MTQSEKGQDHPCLFEVAFSGVLAVPLDRKTREDIQGVFL